MYAICFLFLMELQCDTTAVLQWSDLKNQPNQTSSSLKTRRSVFICKNFFPFHCSEQREMLFLIPHSFTYKVNYETWCLISRMISSSYKLSQNLHMYFIYLVCENQNSLFKCCNNNYYSDLSRALHSLYITM